MSAHYLFQELPTHLPKRLSLSFFGKFDGSWQRVGRHYEPHYDDLRGIAVGSGGLLDSIPSTVIDAVYYFVVGKTIDEELLDCERLDQTFVVHCNSPAAHQPGNIGKQNGHTANGFAQSPTFYGGSCKELDSNCSGVAAHFLGLAVAGALA